ncbi:MAG: sulfatase [Gemmatimonadaceae bacterium]|nr:sulfatase [Gemmatimonadaceae bacterium]
MIATACRTSGGREQPRSTPPNIVVVMVDDLGWQDVQLPLADTTTEMNRRYRTPALMRLAARGTTFTNAYAAAPVCTPTRVAFITGRSPAETHVTNWTQHRDSETSTPFPGLNVPAWSRNGVSASPTTPGAHSGPMLPALLREAGYRTIHAGKAHWGATDTPGADPTTLGFDVNIGGSSAGQPGSHLASKMFSSGPGPGKFRDVPHLEKYHGSDTFLSEALTIEANAAIADAVRAKKPFFLHLAHYAVHTPIEADPRFVQRYLDAGLDPREAAYASQIEGVDKSLADIVSQLEALGVWDNTLVIFMSDNGGLAAHSRATVHTANAPLRSGKGSSYEGGLRVPMVVAWPGHVAQGQRVSVPVITDDLFPTLLDVAGVADAARYTSGIRGRDLTALLAGGADAARQERALRDRVLLWHYPHFWGVRGPGIEPFSAVRVGRWKLIYYYTDRRYELYDLQSDLSETRDLAKTEDAVATRLLGVLRSSLLAANAQMPLDVKTGMAVPLPAR